MQRTDWECASRAGQHPKLRPQCLSENLEYEGYDFGGDPETVPQAVPQGHRIDDWRVGWLGGWDKQRMFFVVMLVRAEGSGRALLIGTRYGDPLH